MGTELVDEVVDVDEEQRQVVHLLRALRRVGQLDEDVEEVKEVDDDRVVELLQFPPVVVVVRVETAQPLVLQRTHDLVVRVERDAKHIVAVLWGKGHE